MILDIETSPVIAYVWQTEIYKAFISADKIIEPTKMLSWAAKWYNDSTIYSSSFEVGPKTMLKGLHKLMDEADVIVHFRGKSFDIPIINKEFIEYGFNPPSPYRQIDLYDIIKYKFRFDNRSLAYLVEKLTDERKIKTGGLQLWKLVMAKDKAAIEEMVKYNEQDVIITEELYKKLLPWIHNHPNYSVSIDSKCCPKCGSEHFQKRGYSLTNAAKYIRYQCQDCGGWFRGTTNQLTHEEKIRNISE